MRTFLLPGALEGEEVTPSVVIVTDPFLEGSNSTQMEVLEG